MIFPEGTWNISENRPVYELFHGVVRMAVRSGAEIVPVAIERCKKRFYVNIGENRIVTGDEAAELQVLRDTMATLKWEIWERLSVCSRAALPEDAATEFLREILNQSEGKDSIVTKEEIEQGIYKNKSIVTQQEVFAFLQVIDIGVHNAFLAPSQQWYRTQFGNRGKKKTS